MFVQCPRCRSLVATDPSSGVPPEFCPYCDSPLDDAQSPSDEVVDAEEGIESVALVQSGMDAPSLDEPAPGSEFELDPATGADRPGEQDDSANDIAIVPETAASIALPADLAQEGTEDAAEVPPVVAEPTADASEKSAAPTAKRKKTATPSFVRRKHRAADRPTPWWMWTIAAGLALLAGLQIVLADRAQLAADARWRPAIASLCGALGCSIPSWREPAAFAMLGREVRQHPYMPGALRVDAAFRNNARWAQPWPDLVLTLSDVDGRALGTRTFSPKEYLGGKVTQNEIGSGQTAAIHMQIMEPAPGVVAFSFDFH